MRKSQPTLLVLLFVAAGLVLLGTGTSSQAQQSAATLKASPYDVIFDDVKVGQSATKTVSLSNAGAVANEVAKIVKYGPHPGDFALAQDLCTGATVAAQATCTFKVVFKPLVPGTRVAHLRVDTDAECSTFLTLAGSGPNDETPDVRVTRAGCAAPAGTASPTPTASASPSPTPAGGVEGFLGTGNTAVCPGRTKVRINFHTNVHQRLRLKTARAKVGGRTFKIKRNQKRIRKVRGYYYSVLDFKGLTAPRYKVKVRGKLTNGKQYARNRIFKNCISSA